MLYRLSILIALTFSLSTLAQNHIDALRYSQESLWGSARYVSMGGAFGALGVWNHQNTSIARLAHFGWLGFIGLLQTISFYL